jgi:hypothetical protein
MSPGKQRAKYCANALSGSGKSELVNSLLFHPIAYTQKTFGIQEHILQLLKQYEG